MKPSVPYWQTVGFLFVSVLGTLLHFLFEWTGGSLPAALISAVNESIWEHMKLLYYPMLVFALAEYRAWGKAVPAFWCVKLAGLALGLALIPVLYYTYTGILGISADWFNITIFFLSAAATYRTETKLFQRDISCSLPAGAAFALFLLPIATFTVLTFLPPHIPFFEDPLTGTYGFQPLTKSAG